MVIAPSLAMTKTLSRQSGWVSLANGAVGGGDEDAPQLLGVAGPHLDDAGIEGARGAVGAENQIEARGQIEIEAAEGNRVEIGGGRLDESLHGLSWPGPEAMSAAVRAAWSRRSGLRLSV